MPKMKYGKTREGKLLDSSRVDTVPLTRLGGRDQGKAERRRLIITLREMQQLLVAKRRGPGKPLLGRRLSRTIPYTLRRMKRDGAYLPAYNTVRDLAIRCLDLGWPKHQAALELAAEWVNIKQGGKAAPAAAAPPLELHTHHFVPDDMDPLEEAVLLQDPARMACHTVMARIRLVRDPEECAMENPEGWYDREELRERLRDIRGALELTQVDMADTHGLSVRSYSRMENLPRSPTKEAKSDCPGEIVKTMASYLPHASTLRKLAALCRENRWPERAAALEKASGWQRRRRGSRRKDLKGD